MDLAAIIERHDAIELFRLAKEKDAGFELDVFAEMTRRFERLPRSDFPLDEGGYERLARKAAAWADLVRHMEREPHRDSGRGECLGLDL
jgi:hypothetical protein